MMKIKRTSLEKYVIGLGVAQGIFLFLVKVYALSLPICSTCTSTLLGVLPRTLVDEKGVGQGLRTTF